MTFFLLFIGYLIAKLSGSSFAGWLFFVIANGLHYLHLLGKADAPDNGSDKINSGHVVSKSELQSAYKTLGVDDTATAEQIKSSYHKLVQEWHPDHNPSDEAKQRFMDIHNAYYNLKRHKGFT